MWSFSRKKKFRMKGFNKAVQFKDLFQSERKGYEIYNTTKPRLKQSGVGRTKGKEKRKNANNQKGNGS